MRIALMNRKKKSSADLVRRAGTVAAGAVAVGAAGAAATRRGRALLFGKGRAAANALTPSAPRDYDDVTLARKVESEIFRSEDSPKGDVNVNAENGVVFLRGQVKTPEQIKGLEVAARKVAGVKDVNNLLHTPGTDALTKVEGQTRSVAAR